MAKKKVDFQEMMDHFQDQDLVIGPQLQISDILSYLKEDGEEQNEYRLTVCKKGDVKCFEAAIRDLVMNVAFLGNILSV